MKRVLSGLLALMMLCSLTACSNKEEQEIDDGGLELITDITPYETLGTTTAPLADVTTSNSANTTVGDTTKVETTTSEETTTTVETTTAKETTTTTSAVVTTTPAPVTTIQTKTETQPSTTTVYELDNTGSSGTMANVASIKEILNTSNAGKSVFYTQLNTKEQKVYDAIVDAIYNFKATVKFEESVTAEEYERIFSIAYYQNPELFWISGKMLLSEDGKSANLVYTFSKDEAKSYNKLIEQKFNSIAKNVTTEMTDLQKVIIANNWLAINNTCMLGTDYGQTVYGAFVDGYAQCEGYAKGFLYMMNKWNIPCVIIIGTKDTGNSHAWCQVKLEGEWYNVDPSGDDTVLPVEDKLNASYKYCCIPNSAVFDKEWFNINYSTVNTSIKLFDEMQCTSYNCNADVVYGYYASSYEEAYEMLKQQAIKAIEKGNTVIHVKMATDEAYVEAFERLVNNKEALNIKVFINSEYGDGETNIIKKLSPTAMNSLNYIEFILGY